ncbi:chitin-binding type-2 domain-containing protein [Trichonephila clavipes]|nr:chitin-binding type-2 domain-containing protein [Trichonephila clavipes]
MALSELHPVYLHVTPEQEFFQAIHSTSRVPPNPTKTSMKKIFHRNPTINVHHNNNHAPNTSPDLKPHSTNTFPLRKNPGASSNPPLTYGFVPRIQKSKQPSVKFENEHEHMQYSNNRFQNSFSNSKLRSPQSPRQQKFEQTNQGLSHVVSQMKEMKSKQTTSFRPPIFPFHNGDIHFNSDHEQNSNARPKDKNTYINNQHRNVERGQESIKRPTTFVRNPHNSFNNNRDMFSEVSERQNNHETDNLKSSHGERLHLPMIKIALNVNAPERSSILNLNGIDESLQDKPIVFLPNPQDDVDSGEGARKTYMLFKAPVLVTTKRPSSAPFTGTSFFRNIPQSVPRQETSQYPEFFKQIPPTQNVHSTTSALKPVTVAYDEDGRSFPFRNSSNINIELFHDADLGDEDSFKSHGKYSDQNLHYKEDPYGAVTEVYSQYLFEPTSGVNAMGNKNASFNPVSSSSSASYTVHQNNNYKSQPKKLTPKKSKAKKTKYAEEESDGHNVPGLPGEDYPTYNKIPLTNFNCKKFKQPGFYADLEAGCQVFHNCDTELQKHSFLCPNGTVFRQELFICDWWYNVKCDDSPEHFQLNDGLYIHP